MDIGAGVRVTDVVGVLLAAGAGTRMGRPKALVAEPDGTPWLHLGVDALLLGGCDRVVVVLGAAADRARALVPAVDGVTVVVADDWAAGPGASLAVGLAAVTGPATACVSLVDLPGLPATAVRRVIGDGDHPTALRRAVHRGVPGHPVVVGSEHRAALVAALSRDPAHGAGPWLASSGAEPVECGDLWDGHDQDHPVVPH
ncbi:CTP:molybdopterin cytidylyltransferase MocA [Curtobacterium sp. PvP017]